MSAQHFPGTPQFHGSYRHCFSDESGWHEEVIDAGAVHDLWLAALWYSQAYRSEPDIADGFAYTPWPKRNAANLTPRPVLVRRIKEGDEGC